MKTLKIDNILENLLFDYYSGFDNNCTIATKKSHNKHHCLDYHYETKEDYFSVELPVPGLTREDISIKVIEGELKIEGGIDNHKWSPKFKKEFLLPTNADINNIKASVERGILIITIGINKKSETIVKIM